jgi:hypothetical protein
MNTAAITIATIYHRGSSMEANIIAQQEPALQSTEFSGKVLMEEGLSVTLRDQPASALLTYKKIAQE